MTTQVVNNFPDISEGETVLPPIVRCSWWDAASIDEWTNAADFAEKTQLALVESAGFLILDDHDRIAIAATYDPDEQNPVTAPDASSIIVIPKRMLADGYKVLVSGRIPNGAMRAVGERCRKLLH